jgi:hypothetical protein
MGIVRIFLPRKSASEGVSNPELHRIPSQVVRLLTNRSLLMGFMVTFLSL